MTAAETTEPILAADSRPASQLSRHLLALARPRRGRLAVVAGCVLAAAVVEIVPPLVVRHVIDHNLTTGNTSGLGRAGLLYLGAVVAVAVLTATYGYLAASVAQQALAELRGRLFAHLLALPTEYHDRTPIGDSISRATADVEAIDDLFSSSAATLLGETARLATVSVAMFLLSPRLTAVAALVVPPLVLITRSLRAPIRDAERDTRVAVGALNTQLAEDLAGAEVIRAFGRQTAFTDRFRAALHGWLRAANRSVTYNAYYAPALGVLAGSATALLLWLGGLDAFGGLGVTVGTLTAFVLLFARFFAPLVNLGDEWNAVQAALAGAERVFAVLDLPTDRAGRQSTDERPGGQATAAGHGTVDASAIALRAVTFGYLPDRPVLREVTLEVRRGEHVAVVGRTGAGKSSVLSLLAGLYQPSGGTVQVGVVDPARLDDLGRRALLGVVPQAVALFSGTVADNITLGDTTLTDAQVVRAAEVAGADTFIAALPDGYGTRLSDVGRGSGVQLSAGQRQLLALARALANRPAVLLLDEATAVVDGASDAAFRAALRERVLPTGTAVLSVAHRLATAREADRVVVMAAGRVIEQGTPAELLAAGGRFADLVALEEAGWDWQHDVDDP